MKKRNVNLATNVTVNSTYAGEFAGEYIAAALLSASTIDDGGLTVKANIAFKEIIKKLVTTSLVTAAGCDFVPTSDITLTERVLTPTELQVNLQLCKQDYYTDYIGQEMAMSAYADLPTSFADFLIAQVAAKVAESVENSLWAGTTGTVGEFDGFTTLLTAAGDANPVTGTASTAANIIEELGKIVDAIPSAVYGKEDLYIYLPQNMARNYVRALGGFAVAATSNNGVGNQGTTWYNGQGLSFDGVKIFVANGLPDNKAVAAEKSNLFFGTGLLEDTNEIRLIDTSATLGDQNVRMIMRFTSGAQVGVSSDCVLYS